MQTINLTPGALTFAQLRSANSGPCQVVLPDGLDARLDANRQVIGDILAERRTVYGVNTGFGVLARSRIGDDQLQQLQRNLVLSHAAGTGPALAPDTVRLILLLKLASLTLGCSGVRPVVVHTLARLLALDLLPVVPAQGSVGASGDLAPLAHLALPLIGKGELLENGTPVPAADALARAGIEPLDLAAKEGLALLNGTNVSTALALEGLFRAEHHLRAAVVAGAMSVDAALGSTAPFDPRVQAVRGHAGQMDVATAYRQLLAGSAINASHLNCDRVQDPYSLRCQPQVMGACLDQLRHAAGVLLTEANAVSDNPLVFTEQGDVISAGNFHAQPVAFAADNLALAIAEIGSLSERRCALLVDPALSQLPPFLVLDAGVNSGFMIAQVTAAALVAENKTLAHPHSVDSLPTSANQEDHVSMATAAGRRLAAMNDNLEGILAIELLSAAQGIGLRRPLASSPPLEAVHAAIRGVAAAWDRDREFAPDIAALRTLLRSDELVQHCPRWLEPTPAA